MGLTSQRDNAWREVGIFPCSTSLRRGFARISGRGFPAPPSHSEEPMTVEESCARDFGSPTDPTGVSHISIQVRDLDEALKFYGGVIGLRSSIETEQHVEGEHNGEYVVVHRRLAYLRWENRAGATFVLLSERAGLDSEKSPARLGDPGIDHVSFLVEDVDAVIERCQRLGFAFMYGPGTHDGADFGHPGGGTVKSAMLRDPDGTYIQVDQWL